MKYKKHLEKYEQRGHFLYNPQKDLEFKCNAPENKRGVYLVAKIKNHKEVLIYIGASGLLKEGKLETRENGLHGKIDKGNHSLGKSNGFKCTLKSNRAKEEMKNQGIEEIIIYWAVIDDENEEDLPTKVRTELLNIYKDEHGRKPDWHKQ